MHDKKWQVGLLGAGYICDAHAKALKGMPDIDLVAVGDRSRQRAGAAAAKFRIPQVFSDLDSMLQADLDAVHVLLPPELHFAAARQILESGRHVFLEKPMALSSAECTALDELAAAKKLRLAANHNFLFLSSYEKLRRHLADGTLGKPEQITVNWLYPMGLIQSGPFDNWILREPQNLILELGPHLLAFLVDLLGPLDHLQTTPSLPIELPGGKLVYRRWHIHGSKGGTTVQINLSVLPGHGERSITVHAFGATAKCDFARDLYTLDKPSGYGLVVDNFMSTGDVARQLAVNGTLNLFKAVAGTLSKGASANPWGESIARSIGAFYRRPAAEPDARLAAGFGAAVMAACEQVVQGARFAPPPGQLPAHPLPPLRVPDVLVIGGTGFIGRHLVEELTAQGYGVRVVTRGIAAAQSVLAGLPVELAAGDLADPAFVDQALTGIEVVYHLAKTTGNKWEDYYAQDVLVTRNIARRAQERGVRRFIYTGTIDSHYSGNAREVITSDSPLDPKIRQRNHYARSKACCEKMLLDLHRQHDFPVVIFRLGIVIGKGCPPAHWGVGMFQSATHIRYWGDGENKLPLVLVQDVVKALLLGMEKPDVEGQVFLVTDQPFLSGREYVDIVSRELSSKLSAHPTPIWKFFLQDWCKEIVKHAIRHPNRRIPSYRDWNSRSHRASYDSTKTRDILGWQPAGNRQALVEDGVIAAVRDFAR